MFDFKMNNLYYYLFLIFGFISILIVLYFWRKIINLTNSNDILDKKCTLLKKENKVLKEDFISKKIPEDSNVVMNEIFNVNDLDENSELKTKLVETTVGRVLFNEVVPEKAGYINQVLTKKSLRDIIGRILKMTNVPETADFLDKIKEMGFTFAFKGGLSFSLGDIIIPDEKHKMIDSANQEVDSIMFGL